MNNMWICKDKKRLYEQNHLADDKPQTESWADCDIALFRVGNESHFWVSSKDFELITFEMVQDVFVHAGITY